MTKRVREVEIGGQVLKVLPVPNMVLAHWETSYNKKHGYTNIVRPQIVLNYAGGEGITYDTNPESAPYKAYLEARDEFETTRHFALIGFLVRNYVKTDPPEDFVVDEELGDNTLANRRLVWVYSIATEDGELATLSTALMGQEEPVESEVQRHVDESKSNGSGDADSSVQVSPEE